MVVLVNRAKMTTATTGTGTITLGSAVSGYQSFADAGVSDGDEVSYVIEDGTSWEIGRGTYTASGTTLSRSVLESTNSDTAINLSGSAEVFVSGIAEDIITQNNVLYVDFDTSDTNDGQDQDRNTGGTFTKVIATVRLDYFIKVTSIKYDIRVDGTYSLDIKDVDEAETFGDFDDEVVTGAPVETTWTPNSTLVLAPATYRFIFEIASAVGWSDSNTDCPLTFAFGALENIYYGSTRYTTYSPAIRLVGKKGVFALANPD